MKAKGATDMKRTFLAGLALCLALPCMAEEEATEILKSGRVIITADMHMGAESATAWGCDLTYDYVSINADYRS